jgi:hypothetical protein
MRMRPAVDDAAEVAVESEDVMAAKTTTAGKIGADTVEAKAVTARRMRQWQRRTRRRM